MSYTTVQYAVSPRAAILLDIPIDDPFGGPAYGKREKSSGLGMVVGIVASVVTMGVGAAAWAAASTAGGMLAAGAMMAGGAMSGIGAITGNKKLSRIGGILSLAGGIGSAFASPSAAGAAAGHSSLAGEAASNFSSSVSDAMTKVSDSFTSSMKDLGITPGAGSASATSGAMDVAQPTIDLGNGASTGASSAFGPATAPEGAVLKGNTTFNIASSPDPMGVNQSIGGIADTTGQATGTMGVPMPSGTTSPLNAPAAVPGAGTATGAAGSDKGLIGRLMDFGQSNGGGYVVGQVLQGMGQGAAQQQQLDFLKQRYGNDQAILQQQLQNINFQYQVIDPNDPQAAQKAADAKAKGIPTISVGINPGAQVAAPNLSIAPKAGA